MAITFPLTDIMTMVDYSADTQPLQLVSRQEQSRLASGATRGKDLGPALWLGNFVTAPIPNRAASAFEAVMDSLDGLVQTFEACDFRCLMPAAHPDGDCNDGVLLSVNANNKAVSLSGLAPHQVVSVGDFLSFDYGTSRALHRVAQTVTANASGETAEFEVRPHIRPGWTLDPETAVKLKNPRGIFTLVPGSYSPRSNGALHTVISFQAGQYLE